VISRGPIGPQLADQADTIRVVREWGSGEVFAIYDDPDHGRIALPVQVAEAIGVVSSAAGAAVAATPEEVAVEASDRSASEAASLADERRARAEMGGLLGDLGESAASVSAGLLGGIVNGAAGLLGGAAGTLLRQHPVITVLGVLVGAVVVIRALR